MQRFSGLMAESEMDLNQTNDSSECPLLQDEETARAIHDLTAVTGMKWINNGLEFPVKFPICNDKEIKTRLNEMVAGIGEEWTNYGIEWTYNGIECPYSEDNEIAAFLSGFFPMELEEDNNRVEVPEGNDIGGKTRVLNSVSSSLVRFPHKILNLFKGNDSYGFSLEKQLQAWRENSSWVDQPPTIKVLNSPWDLNVEVDIGLPPDTVYNMLTDPKDERIFKNIKSLLSQKLLVDDDRKQVMEVAMAVTWSMFWWSRTMSGRVLLSNNKEEKKVTLKPRCLRFMDSLEGCWDAEVSPIFVDEKACFPSKPKSFADYYSCTRGKGRLGSRVSLTQGCPAPFLWRLRGIKTTPDQLITDLLEESAKVRESLSPLKSYEELNLVEKINETTYIKERWSIRRRMTKRHQRSFLAASPSIYA